MTDTVFIGDIHGHVETVERALEIPHNVVFVGDYLDSFSQSPDNQVRCLTMVLDAIENEPDRVTGLLGNHELSYLYPDMRCSGYNWRTDQITQHLRTRMLSLLKPFVWVGKYLASHAGVSQDLLDEEFLSLEDYLEIGDFNQIGRFRGGLHPVGGLFWNDFNEEMNPIKGVHQVVGHTNSNRYVPLDRGVRAMRTTDGTGMTWCIDNLNRIRQGLKVNDAGEAEPFDF